jgi:multidrug transporter EmrE-like cation transporter
MGEKQMNGFILLLLAIFCEVVGSSNLKASQGFTLVLPSIVTVLGYGLSFWLFSLSLRTLSLSTAYAVWAGLGVAGTTAVSVIIFRELLTMERVIAMLLIIGGVVLLHSDMENKQAEKERST